MLDGLIRALLQPVVRRGDLTLTGPGGRVMRFGDGTGPKVAVRLSDAGAARALLRQPELALGELYMDGRLIVETGSIAGLLDILMGNLHDNAAGPLGRLRAFARRLTRSIAQWNPAGRARRNVAHHYDLSGALYDLFLDSDRQYSCAYFARPEMSLDEAQQAKLRHIAAKLALKPGQRVLDIGCGWGGMALHLARAHGVEVLGITLSQEQLAIARDRAARAGLSQRCRFALTDYRAVEGRFDRIVSVGMFEHVGIGHYAAFFDTVKARLSPDGAMLLHAIGRSDGPGATNPWIAKYIFPGGYTPALSEVLPQIERAGLWTTDVEILRLHYAETLRHWRERFLANRRAAAALYDERFCRMWEFYLAGAEMGFRHQGLMVFQIQLAASQEALPLTRDYMVEAERPAADAATPARRGAA